MKLMDTTVYISNDVEGAVVWMVDGEWVFERERTFCGKVTHLENLSKPFLWSDAQGLVGLMVLDRDLKCVDLFALPFFSAETQLKGHIEDEQVGGDLVVSGDLDQTPSPIGVQVVGINDRETSDVKAMIYNRFEQGEGLRTIHSR
tara:strand:- start:16794 stop:17228 length:435 start_codon:yes stop_codon:yes gene_type:complete